MAMRTPPNIAARDLKGIPGQPLLVYLGDRLPEKLANTIFRIAQRVTFRRPEPLWHPPRTRWCVTPTIDCKAEAPRSMTGLSARSSGVRHAWSGRWNGSTAMVSCSAIGARLHPDLGHLARPGIAEASNRWSAIWGSRR